MAPIPPAANAVLKMADQLGISKTEYHLLPVAKHALHSCNDTNEEEKKDISWFKELVESERARSKPADAEATTWMMFEENGSKYYFDFKTMKKSTRKPIVPQNRRIVGENQQIGVGDIAVLRFKSWWTEGKTKHYISINYEIEKEEFIIDIEDDDQIYTLSDVVGKYGPVTLWDLHIGAVLQLFGRSVTLMQCSSETRDWIENNAKKLFRLRIELEDKLSRYERVKTVHLAKKPLVQTHLRQLMKDVSVLKGRISEYRPSFATNS